MEHIPDQLLGDPLPPEPLEIAGLWLAEAWKRRSVPNPNAMTLATSSPDGRPAARVVLCKEVTAIPGYLVFYTNYHSRKGLELAANPRAAAVLHFDHLHRQVRIEGVVQPAPAADSDAYFASRALESRIGAWASDQSRPVASRAALLEQVAAAARRFPDGNVPRPQHWGGYRLWADCVELWIEGTARVHDRARWTRSLTARPGGFQTGPWSATRLQP
ncbi:MAG TPA: pyridoxamine 5'-phosphate oxidase [Steroidobacteraceae bacterium]|nr:pyridoxamine 5'-phosphate oxidase [Steroidobacteraceae bacterium]